MTQFPLWLFFIGVSVISCLFTVRRYRKATPVQRRQIVMAGIGAVAVALFALLLIATR